MGIEENLAKFIVPYNALLKELSDFVNPLLTEIVTKAGRFDIEMEAHEGRAYTENDFEANREKREEFAKSLSSSYSLEREKQWKPRLEEFRTRFNALPFPKEAKISLDLGGVSQKIADLELNRQYNVPLDMYIGLEYPDMLLIPTYTNPQVPITAKWGDPIIWLSGALMDDVRLTLKQPVEITWQPGIKKKNEELVRPSESTAGCIEASWQDGKGYFWSREALKKGQDPEIKVPLGEAGFHYDFWAIRNAYFSPKAIGSGEIDALLEHFKLVGTPARPERFAKTE